MPKRETPNSWDDDYRLIWNRLQDAEERVTRWRRRHRLLKAALKQAYIDGGCREVEAEEMVAAVGTE